MARSLVTRGVSVLALSLGLALPRALNAQSYTEQMQGYMNTAAQTYAFSQGYAAVTAMVTGNLNASANTSHALTLTGGRNYVIIGVCDRDCTDVDLRLYDPMGNNIATDVATDDHPVLRFTAATSGSYRLQVEMAACSHNPCYYGVQLFSGNGGVAITPQPMSPQPINQPQPLNVSAPTQMGTIAFNQQVTGNLQPSDGRLDNKPAQSWAFACQQGQAFQMDILSTWDNYAVVLDPMGNRAAQDDDTGGSLNARITHTCAMTGVYRLVITTYSPSTTTGNYTLQVQQSTPVVLNQPAPLNAPTPMSPTPMAAPTPVPTPIPMPTRVRTQAQSSNQGATMPTPSPGSLPITGTIPAPGVIGMIQVGTNVQGRLETGDQRMNDGTFADVWQFQGTAGQHVRVELRSEEFDTYVQLLDAQGNRLAEDDDSLGDLNSMVEINLPATGMYQIVVNNFGEDRRAGIYTLSLR